MNSVSQTVSVKKVNEPLKILNDILIRKLIRKLFKKSL